MSVKCMYEEYLKTRAKISYSAFYSVFKSMNITIARLGNKLCEFCERYGLHKASCECEDICDISEYIQHKKKYKAARKEYENDKGDKGDKKNVKVTPKDFLKVSVDL